MQCHSAIFKLLSFLVHTRLLIQLRFRCNLLNIHSQYLRAICSSTDQCPDAATPRFQDHGTYIVTTYNGARCPCETLSACRVASQLNQISFPTYLHIYPCPTVFPYTRTYIHTCIHKCMQTHTHIYMYMFISFYSISLCISYGRFKRTPEISLVTADRQSPRPDPSRGLFQAISHCRCRYRSGVDAVRVYWDSAKGNVVCCMYVETTIKVPNYLFMTTVWLKDLPYRYMDPLKVS